MTGLPLKWGRETEREKERERGERERIRYSCGNRNKKRFYAGVEFQGLDHVDWLNIPNAKLKICVSYCSD